MREIARAANAARGNSARIARAAGGTAPTCEAASPPAIPALLAPCPRDDLRDLRLEFPSGGDDAVRCHLPRDHERSPEPGDRRAARRRAVDPAGRARAEGGAA